MLSKKDDELSARSLRRLEPDKPKAHLALCRESAICPKELRALSGCMELRVPGPRPAVDLLVCVALRLAGRAHQPAAGADAAAAEVAAGIARLTSRRSSGAAFGTFGLTEARSFVPRA